MPVRESLLAVALMLSATAHAADPPVATKADHTAGETAQAATKAAKEAMETAGQTAAEQAAASEALKTAIAGSWRDPKNVARDKYRHPFETLRFFDLRPGDTVIEITPGGGWYSEILAPYLREHGQYVAAVVDPTRIEKGREYQQKAKAGLEAKFSASPTQYDLAGVLAYDPNRPVFGLAGSADLVLTFRNVHNWRSAGQAEGMFKGFFDVLKSGGVLGVVEHRAKKDVPADDNTGYVGQAQVIAFAEAAGFRLDEQSEINANPKDTKDYPNGVWTLPPSNDHDAKDDAKYQAIGESDRMTLRFVKP
jgi:predicted methyltransferase